MEILVEEALEEYIERNDKICKCDKCLMDIKAYALNKLPPHYVVTEKGYIYNKIGEMKTQFKVDLLKTIVEATEIIENNKRHN